MSERKSSTSIDCSMPPSRCADDPSLASKPLAVGVRQIGGVIATSQPCEARGYACTRQWLWAGAEVVPGSADVKPRMEVFKGRSREIQAIFRDYTELMSPCRWMKPT
jgi:DNA polymerase-4